MQQLTLTEIEVNGGVSQELAVGTNMGIISIGVGIALAGTAPAWFPLMMIGVSAVTTFAFIEEQLNGENWR